MGRYKSSLGRVKWAVNIMGANLNTDWCKNAIMNGCIDVIKFLRSHNEELNNAFDDKNGDSLWVTWAASYGNIDVLKWLLENTDFSHFCLHGRTTYECAASGGHLNILKWLQSIKPFWLPTFQQRILSWYRFYEDSTLCWKAARGGHLDTLMWLRNDHNCQWDEWTTFKAAKKGHLEVLKWARENDCPWDEWTCIYAAEFGHLEVLKWARANGCPWDKKECLSVAKEYGHVEIVEWVESQPE